MFVRFCLACLFLGSVSLYPEETSLNALLNRTKNCEIELEMLKNSISSQEQSREALEKEMSALLHSTKDTLKETQEGGDKQKKNFEKTVDKLTQDLKQLKKHENDLSQSINDLTKTVESLKESDKKKSQAIKELEEALRTLTLALSGKSAPKPSTNTHSKTSSYTVKSGDSLEKIARAHSMTIAELKEMNHLSNSTIRPGQELSVKGAP
jgi:LysM repeat protein